MRIWNVTIRATRFKTKSKLFIEFEGTQQEVDHQVDLIIQDGFNNVHIQWS